MIVWENLGKHRQIQNGMEKIRIDWKIRVDWKIYWRYYPVIIYVTFGYNQNHLNCTNSKDIQTLFNKKQRKSKNKIKEQTRIVVEVTNKETFQAWKQTQNLF